MFDIYIYIYTHTLEYYSAIKNKNLPFVTTWMDLEDIISEISQREKDKYQIPYDFTYMWNLKTKQTNK